MGIRLRHHELLMLPKRTLMYTLRSNCSLTLKAAITTAADDSLEYFFIVFSDKIMLDISCESSFLQRIHLKHHALFSSKDKSKNNKSVVAAIFLAL